MLKLFFKLHLLLIPFFLSAQSSGDIQHLYENAERLEYNNPNKALKFTKYIVLNTDKTSDNTDIFKASLLQIEILIAQENYDEATRSLLNSFKLMSELKDSFLRTKYYFLLSKVLLQLNMTEQFDKTLIQFKNFSGFLDQNELKCSKNWLWELTILQKFHQRKFDESLKLIKAGNFGTNVLDQGFHDRMLMILNYILFIKNEKKEIRNDFKTPFYRYFSGVDQLTYAFKSGNKDYSKIKELEVKRQFFGSLNFIPLYKVISKSTCAHNNAIDCFYFKNQYIKLLKDRVNNSQNARLSILNLLQTIDKMQLENEKSKRFTIAAVMTSFFAIILLLLLGYFYYLKNTYQKIKSARENDRIYDGLKQQLSNQNKNIPIPQKTEQIILTKLAEFENNQEYLKPELSLSFLANRLETNSKYLSEVINKHKNKNFNTYINEQRIDYIIAKLKNNREYRQYKSSYLATEAGFSSRTSFSTIFKNIVGKSLTQYIEHLENDDE